MEVLSTNILVVGGGPVGLFAVVMCGLMGFKCTVLEALPFLGGQCAALYPKKPIYDIPAFPSILAEDLISSLTEQMSPFQPAVLLEEAATKLQRLETGEWLVITSHGRHIHAKAIIITCGKGAFQPKKPPIAGIEAFEENSIFYSVKDPGFFHGKDVVIAGGGDSAMDWAMVLSQKARSLHIVHRRMEFRGSSSTAQQLQQLQGQENVYFHMPFQLHALEGKDGILHTVFLEDIGTNAIKPIQVQHLLPFFGMDSHLGDLLEWGLHMNKGYIVIDPVTGQTNLPGIYAAGDVAIYPYKHKLIVTGFSEASQIAYGMRSYLYPQETNVFRHSTSQGIPGVLR